MKENKLSQDIKEYQFNKLLSKDDQNEVIKAKTIVAAFDLWDNDKITFEDFKEQLKQ